METMFKKDTHRIFSKGRIGRRLVVATILFSSLITLAATVYQLHRDYRHDLKAIHRYFDLIENSYIESLANSVWMYDGRQIVTQLDGLAKFPDLAYLEVRAGDKYTWTSGSPRAKHVITRLFPLRFRHENQVFTIGVLKATASLDNVYARLMGKAAAILIANAVRAFMVSGFILLIFHFLVARHLIELADHVRRIDPDRLPEQIALEKKRVHSEPDEIDQVVHALNETQAKLHQAYEARRAGEAELSRIFTMSIDLICVADIQTATFIKVNPAFTKTLGYSEAELTSTPFLEFIHPDDIAPTTRIVEEDLRAGKQVINFENRYRCKDGTYRWLRWVSHPMPETGVTYAVAHDITKIKDSMGKLEEAHGRFLTVLDAIDAHIYVADMESYEILFMNAKMKQDFGRDHTGGFCWAVFRGESGPCGHCTNDRIVDSAGNPTGVCVWQDQNPRTGRWYINHDRAIRWVDGRIVRLQIATDITALKEMERALRQSHKMEAVGTLAGGVAHDFNNLLHMIIGNAELALEDMGRGNPARTNVEEIRSAGLRAAGIVRQLLNFSRKNEPTRKPVDLVAVVEDALKFLRSTIPATIEIRQRLPETAMGVVADPIQINQVMMNICTNAFQAMERTGGVVDIQMGTETLGHGEENGSLGLPPGNYAKIVIEDSGPGIDPEIIGRIFDPYFTTKAPGKGSGMGLAVVHGIVENHGGAVRAESRPDRGTRFSLLFPLADRAPERPPPIDETPVGGDETVLVVDDEPAVAGMVRKILERLGYCVDAQTDPEAALAVFCGDPDRFDLVVTDMTMPRMTGVEFCQKARAIRPTIPLIICTGHSALLDPEEAKRRGIDAFVQKPVAKADLAAAVRRVLDRRKTRR